MEKTYKETDRQFLLRVIERCKEELETLKETSQKRLLNPNYDINKSAVRRSRMSINKLLKDVEENI